MIRRGGAICAELCGLPLNAALHFTPKAYPEGPPRFGSLFRIKNPSLFEIMNFFTWYERPAREKKKATIRRQKPPKVALNGRTPRPPLV